MSFFCSEINLSYCDILHGYIICSVYHKFSNICKPEEGWYLGKGGGGGRGTQQMLMRGGSAPRSNPLPFYIQFFHEKRYPFGKPSIDKWYPVHKPCLELNGPRCSC